MARQNAMSTGQSSSQFEPRPNDEELRDHIDAMNIAVPHVAITFMHLTPMRTRIIAEAQWDPDLEKQAIEVANADAIEVARMERLAREGINILDM